MRDMAFSILMSVYAKESPVFLKQALDSVLGQTMLPSQIVLVKDGPLTASLEKIIENISQDQPDLFCVVSLKENIGLGQALNIGLKYCSYDIVARMDTDDIAVKDRFEYQFNFLYKNPDVAVVGGTLEEFRVIPGDLNRFRKLPLSHELLKKFALKRNPMNHPSVMFRKSAILDVGGYESIFYFEDYHLWMKLLKQGFILANMEKVLLHFRIGNDMIARRHGYRYIKHEWSFLNNAFKNQYMGLTDYTQAIVIRTPLRLLPRRVLSFIYKNKLR